jgi:hypothetical protein
MASSPAHRWGQIIGEIMEAAVLPLLERFARKHKLYLDRKGPRPCRRGRKCGWKDSRGNVHDLDFVLERGGTLDEIGTPAAFIEIAWRRYTKHSRNKAQEIQGAIIPLAETYSAAAPFKGAILGGVFTDGALTQMRSHGFTLLYFPYDMFLDVFRRFGIDAASEEDTPDSRFETKVRAFGRLTEQQRTRLCRALVRRNAAQVKKFIEALATAISRHIDRIVVLPLHGTAEALGTVEEAIAFIRAYSAHESPKPILRYEIQVRYSNGDTIEGQFGDKQAAIEFLRSYGTS